MKSIPKSRATSSAWGSSLKVQANALTIIRVITGSPAEQAGVRAGDRIIAVDGRTTSSMSTDQAANLLQGVEGSYAALTVAGEDGQERQMNVRRRRIDVPSVDQVSVIDRENGIGYFKLNCFQKTTAHDLDAALWKLQRDGMRSLIVDVRGNPGGLLVASVEAVNRFVDHGVVVTTHGRNAQEDNTFTAHAEGIWQIPLVVIVDQDSASAAEIFAGAIHDLHRGTIVGVRILWQRFGPRHLPAGWHDCRHPLDHGQVLFALRPPLQRDRR